MSQFAANFQGPYALLQAVLPLLEASNGLVIFIISTDGLAASPGAGPFAATQHAMRALADSIREEVNALGVRVSTLFLGRSGTAGQTVILAKDQGSYAPDLLVQAAAVADVIVMLAMLPTTSEVTEITLQPQVKSYWGPRRVDPS
jgi:NADP-dependent 3-hydroxy acid dehydrogenase YdfG